MKWIGKGHLVTIDYDALNGNKPRLKLSHVPWKNLVHPEDPFTIPPPGWVASLPLSVMGTYWGKHLSALLLTGALMPRNLFVARRTPTTLLS